MPRLDPEYLTTEPAQARRRPRPRPASAQRAGRDSPEETVGRLPETEGTGSRGGGLGAVLWPAAATFAMVFAAGLYLFWLRLPGQQPAVLPPARAVALPAFALVAGWIAAVRFLPRILPRTLAWLLLAGATVFVAIVMGRDVTAWLRAALGSTPF